MILSNKDPFGAKAWGEFLNQLSWLEEHKLGREDVAKALEEVKQEEKPFGKLCPQCSVPMQLMAVNFDSATQTGDDSKSMWLCPQCLHEEFSPLTVQEQLRR